MECKEIFTIYPELAAARGAMEQALAAIVATYRAGGKILLCGNGGSAADCEHITGELMKGFLLRRKPTKEEEGLFSSLGEDGAFLTSHLQRGIPAISLPSQAAVLSAYANDVEPSLVYAQLVYGYGRREDLLLGLSTSGNSKNVVYAMKTAKALGMRTLALTGQKESALSALADITIRAPHTETYRVQEYHLPIYHWLCAEAERVLFAEA